MAQLSPKQRDFAEKAYAAAAEAGLRGVQADVAVAQAAHETGWGAKPSGTNNYHGIKGPGKSVKTHEIVDGRRVNIKDSFRNFPSMAGSFKAWGGLMGRRFSGVLSAPTLKDAVSSLRAGQPGGYATDPNYNGKVNSIASKLSSFRTTAPSLPSIDRIATPVENPRTTMTASVTPVERSPLAPVSGFKPGGLLSPPNVSFSPVSSAQAAPSPGAMMSPQAQSFSAPNASRFGPATRNVSYSALGPALSAQAQSVSPPSPDRFGPTTPNATRAQLASALTAQAQLNAAPQAPFSPTPASYQSPAFSTAAPKVDAFGQPPHPGLMPAAPSQYTQPQAPAPRTITTPTIAAPAAAPISAPQVNPALDQYPDRPKQPGLLSSIFAKPTVPSVVGSLIGTAALGPVGGVLGGLLGRAVASNTGGLLGGYTGSVNNIGGGLAAVNSVMSGAPVGTQANTSNGQTVTSVPGGIARYSSKYGWTEITDPKTGMTSFNKNGGGNGGIRSGSVRDAMDKADKAGKSGVGSSGGLY